MATSLAFHLTFAVFGFGLPVMMLIAEGLHLRTGDPAWLALARRWSKAFAILFAVGAVSGTIISFELGSLWPGFTKVYVQPSRRRECPDCGGSVEKERNRFDAAGGVGWG